MLDEISIQNINSSICSQKYFKQTFLGILKSWGMQVEELQIYNEENDAEKEEFKQFKQFELDNIIDIQNCKREVIKDHDSCLFMAENISAEKYDKMKQNYNKLDTAEKQSIIKYDIISDFGILPSSDKDIQAKLEDIKKQWSSLCRKDTRTIMRNHKRILGGFCATYNLEKIDDGISQEYIDAKNLKVLAVNEILRIFGYENIYDEKPTSKAQLVENINKQYERFSRLFGLTKKWDTFMKYQKKTTIKVLDVDFKYDEKKTIFDNDEFRPTLDFINSVMRPLYGLWIVADYTNNKQRGKSTYIISDEVEKKLLAWERAEKKHPTTLTKERFDNFVAQVIKRPRNEDQKRVLNHSIRRVRLQKRFQ